MIPIEPGTWFEIEKKFKKKWWQILRRKRKKWNIMLCKCQHPANSHEDKIHFRGACLLCGCRMFDEFIPRPKLRTRAPKEELDQECLDGLRPRLRRESLL